jgi:hypothetical protein
MSNDFGPTDEDEEAARAAANFLQTGNPHLSIGHDGKYHHNTGTGDWRLNRVYKSSDEAYDDAIRWHNARIADGTDPRSGLRSLPYIPWDEKIDGVAQSMGAAGYAESSYERNGGHYQALAAADYQTHDSTTGCLFLFLLALLALGALILLGFVPDGYVCADCWIDGLPFVVATMP